MMKKRKKKKMLTKRQKLRRIDNREKKRLGAQAVVNTKRFVQRQKFGQASAVRKIRIEDYDEHNNS